MDGLGGMRLVSQKPAMKEKSDEMYITRILIHISTIENLAYRTRQVRMATKDALRLYRYKSDEVAYLASQIGQAC